MTERKAMDRELCGDPSCVLCSLLEPRGERSCNARATPVGGPLVQADRGGSCYCSGRCDLGERCAAYPDGKPGVRQVDPFPSLSLMTKPVTPALPRLTPFTDTDLRLGRVQWRCRVELKDIMRRRAHGPSLSDYAAPSAEGWGSTPERAYNAWKSKWRALFEPKHP